MKSLIRNIVILFIISIVFVVPVSAREMTINELGDYVAAKDNAIGNFYIIGEYVFTSKYKLDTQDIMLSARSIKAVDAGDKKTDPIFDKMTIFRVRRTYNGITPTGWEVTSNYVGNDKITLESSLNVKYVDYEKVKDVFTVEFDTKGGNTITSMIIEEGEYIKELPTPEREGYNFIHWYLDSEDVAFNKNENAIHENITLHAKWKAKSFTLTFDDENVDEENKIVTYTYETSMDDLTPTDKTDFKPNDKVGYNFLYWYEEGNDKEYDFTQPLDKNVELKAKWELKDMTVIFKNDDKEEYAKKVVKYGQKVEGVDNPSKNYNTFVGWFKCNDTDCSNTEEIAFDLVNTPITENITLIAKYNPNTYTLKFDDPNVPEEKKILSYTYPHLTPSELNYKIEEEYKLEDKPGYTFVYWYDVEVGEDTKFDFNSTIERDTVLNAKWEGKKLVVTFINDNDEREEQVEYDHHVTEPTNPSKEGYIFDGWFKCTNDDCTTIEDTKFSFDSYITEDTKLKAKWTAISYTITFDDESVDAGSKTVKYTYSTSMDDLKPLNKESFKPNDKEGNIFEYWYDVKVGEDTPFNFKEVLTKDVTLKAKWTKVSYTITFDDENVDNSDRTKTYTYNNSMNDLTPSDKEGFKPKDKTGYTFEYWYEEGNETQFDFQEALTKNVTLKAKWKINTYTVTFTDGVESQTVEYNKKATRPEENPSKEGNNFVGWFKCTNDDCSETEDEEFDFENTPIVEDIKLKAAWETIRITVTFKNYDKNIYTTKRLDYNTDLTIDDINNPERINNDEYNGYRFLGWYKCTDESCEEQDSEVFNFDTNGKGLKENLTLIAKYELIVYTNRIASDFVENMNFEDFSTILGGDTKIYFNILNKDALLSKNFDKFVTSIEKIINVKNVKDITIKYNEQSKTLNSESNVSDEFKEIFNALTNKDFDTATTLDLDDTKFTLTINLEENLKNSADQNTDTYEVVFDSKHYQVVEDEQEFTDALGTDKEIILASDITINNVINITNDVAIDGRNHKLISNVTDSKYLFNITSGSVVLKDIDLKIDTLKPSEYNKENHTANTVKNTIAIYVGKGAKLTVTNVNVISDVTINDLKMGDETLTAHEVSVNQNAAVLLHGELYGNGLTYQNEYYGSPTIMMASNCTMKIDGLHKVTAVYDIVRAKGADGQNRNEDFIHLYKNSDHTELKFVLYSFNRRFLPIAYLHGEKFIIPEAFNEGGEYYSYTDDAGDTYEFNGTWSYYDSNRKYIDSNELKEKVVTDTNISLLIAQYSKKES